jgi:hypothetical protein
LRRTPAPRPRSCRANEVVSDRVLAAAPTATATVCAAIRARAVTPWYEKRPAATEVCRSPGLRISHEARLDRASRCVIQALECFCDERWWSKVDAQLVGPKITSRRACARRAISSQLTATRDVGGGLARTENPASRQ